MATTNFTQHNPSEANQQDDATFDADSITTGGIGTDDIMPSKWMNKRWYQDSTFITAFAQMLVAKGISTSDANVSTLAAALSVIVINSDLKPAQINVAFSPTPTFDCSLSNGFRIDLSGNVTSSTLTNVPAPGTLITFYIVSGNPGNFSFAWPSTVHFPRNVQNESLGNLFTQQFISDGTNLFPVETFLDVLFGQIATAQGTANTAVANAAAAQGSANTALAEIAALVLGATQGAPARAFNNTYQNTSGGIMFISGYGNTAGSSTGQIRCNVGSVSPSSTVFANENTASVSGAPAGFSFMVPPGFFYSVVTSGDITGVGAWVETIITL